MKIHDWKSKIKTNRQAVLGAAAITLAIAMIFSAFGLGIYVAWA